MIPLGKDMSGYDLCASYFLSLFTRINLPILLSRNALCIEQLC